MSMADKILIIPAAGKGTRLGSSAPKIFTRIDGDETVFDYILNEAAEIFDEIRLILSPEGQLYVKRNGISIPDNINILVQKAPTGMFDAIDIAFSESLDTHKDERIFIQWGDQPLINKELYKSLIKGLELFDAAIPLIWVQKPYVQFKFSENKLKILESREGDQCEEVGFKDIGLFSFDKKKLLEVWEYYKSLDYAGSVTNEKSFLKILEHFSNNFNIHWELNQPTYRGLGINTRKDLEEIKKLLYNFKYLKY